MCQKSRVWPYHQTRFEWFQDTFLHERRHCVCPDLSPWWVGFILSHDKGFSPARFIYAAWGWSDWTQFCERTLVVWLLHIISQQILPWTATSPIQRCGSCYILYLFDTVVSNWKLKITKCNNFFKLIFKLRSCLRNFKWILDSSLPRVALMGVLYKGRTNQICIYILNLIS